MPMTIPAITPPESPDSPSEDEEDRGRTAGEGARVGWADGGRAVNLAVVAPVIVESPVAP